MTIEEVKDYINSSPEYDFLRDYPHKIAFLTLGGSYAYGTNTEDSDIDLRGVFLSDKREILLNDSAKLVDTKKDTDTVMYTLKKYVDLCAKGNPTTLELLYNRPECYLYISDIGMELIKNRNMFLSKKIWYAFDGCVEALNEQTVRSYDATVLTEDQINLVRKKACKAMMHVIRVMHNGTALLKTSTMQTYNFELLRRTLLLLRDGVYCSSMAIKGRATDHIFKRFVPSNDFGELFDVFYQAFENAFKTTTLPDEPDWDRINNFLMTTNERIVRGMV